MKKILFPFLLGIFYAASVNAAKYEIRAQDAVKTENTASGAPDGYGDSLITRRPGNIPTSATYEVTVPKKGRYKFVIDYAAAEPRPLLVTVNGQQITGNAASASTGGWLEGNRKLSNEGNVNLKKGKNTIMLSRGSDFPHVWFIILDGPQ